MSESLVASIAARRQIELEGQINTMEQELARLTIRLKYLRDERDRQIAIARHHTARAKDKT